MADKWRDYQILTSDSRDELSKMVSAFLAQGWHLYGDAFTAHEVDGERALWFCQVVVK